MKVATIFLLRGEKTYVNQRKGCLRNYPGMFQNAGGKVEEGEPIFHAAQRELQEETGLSIALGRFELIARNTYHHTNGQAYQVNAFAVELQDHEIPQNCEPDKHEDWCLVDLDWLEEHQHQLVPALLPSLNRIFRRLNTRSA